MTSCKTWFLILMGCCLPEMLLGDEWDPGDDVGSGSTWLTMEVITKIHGPHSLGMVDSNDWFKVTLTAGNLISLQSAGGADLIGSLYSDAEGSVVVAYNDDDGGRAGNNFRIDYMPLVSADYYLKVYANPEGADADYSLNYVFLPPQDSWDPIDDVGTGATMLAIEESEAHVLSVSDTNDWFKVTLTAGVGYRFESSGEWDPLGVLYNDSDGLSEVAADDDSGLGYNFLILYTPSLSGDYYLKVSSYGGDATAYVLKYMINHDADADADGMPDEWELLYLGGTNAQPNAHADADGQSNLQEYIAGTDPTNSASFFAVTNWSASSFILQWPSFAEREYKVLWAASLTNSFLQQGDMIAGPQNSYTDAVHNANDSGFYKVEVQLK